MSKDSTPQAPSLIIPPSIARLRSPVGVNRRGMKILVFGEAKSGKSFFLASMPKPIFAIDAGEGGIQQYLSAEDQCFEATDPDSFLKLCNFALEHEKDFPSIVIDPVTTTWEDWMDFYSEKFGGEIRGSQWNAVKGPWKVLAKRLNRSKQHVGMGAWLKDTLFEKPETAPGVEGKLAVRAVEVPQVERKTIYHVDILLQTSIVRDAKNRPTTNHRITMAGGRRPKSVNPEAFHAGKNWTFNAKKPTSPWDTIIAPIAEKWDEGAVDYLGVDERGYDKEHKDLDTTSQEYTVGQILMLMESQENFNDYKNRVWPNDIAPIVNELEQKYQDRIMKEHEAVKKRIGTKK